MNRLEPREVIDDRNITDEVYEQLFGYTCYKLQDRAITQKDIVKLLLPKKISNRTIARIINDVIPEAHATKGSVASIINSMRRSTKKKRDITSRLLDEIAKDMYQ